MLNKNLQDEVLINIYGGIFNKQRLFYTIFDERLLSEMIFMLQQKNFNKDDHVFEEGDTMDTRVDHTDMVKGQILLGNKRRKDEDKNVGLGMFFVISGSIIVLQKLTKTYITDLAV